jgi:hypothetical protein
MKFTFEQYLYCVVMFILGQAFHLFLVKIPAIKKRCKAANKKFYFTEWWAEDWNVIIGTQVVGAMVILGLKEIVTWKPGVIEYVRWFFAAVGAFGSVVAMAKASQFEANLTHLLSIKSNVSDAVSGRASNAQDAITQGSEATGRDVTTP